MGVFPCARHDGTEFSWSDRKRAERSGDKMVCMAAVVHIKGDWAEFCNTLGFPTWQSKQRPCLMCNAEQARLYEHEGASPTGLPWHTNTPSDYDQACRRCEIKVTIETVANRNVIAAALHYDKRKDGCRGRALRRDVAGLLAGDRLEPSDTIMDVADFESLQLPVTVTFWRSSRQTFVLHRNPLLCSEAFGLSVRLLSLDTLHTLNLGVIKAYCMHVIWKLIE